MLAVSVTLDEVARSCARARSNRSTLLPADQGSAYRAGYSTDNGDLRLAVVMSVGPPVSQAVRSNGQHNKNEHQQHCDDVLLSDVLYHLPCFSFSRSLRTNDMPTRDVDSVH
jgi:hypothetical protein